MEKLMIFLMILLRSCTTEGKAWRWWLLDACGFCAVCVKFCTLFFLYRHYFSKNGLPTITALMYSGEMGQRTYLTPKDLRRIRTLYQCGLYSLRLIHLVKECFCVSNGLSSLSLDKTLPEDDEKFLNFFDRLKEFYLHVPGISANLNTNN